MKIKTVHYISGLLLAVFVLLHLGNHLAALAGVEAHIGLMTQLRAGYRALGIEAFLLGAVGVQAASGLRLYWQRRKAQTDFYGKVQLWTGLYLAFFFMMHVGAVLVGRFVLGLDTNFYFGAAGLNVFPINLFFVPYYGLAVVSFFGHVAAIHAQKMRFSVLGISPQAQANIILLAGIIISVLIIYAMTNGFAGAEIPNEYKLF